MWGFSGETGSLAFSKELVNRISCQELLLLAGRHLPGVLRGQGQRRQPPHPPRRRPGVRPGRGLLLAIQLDREPTQDFKLRMFVWEKTGNTWHMCELPSKSGHTEPESRKLCRHTIGARKTKAFRALLSTSIVPGIFSTLSWGRVPFSL